MEGDRSSDVEPADDGFDPWPKDADVHVEWGPAGAALAARRGDLVVIVDVLSFSTSVVEVVAAGATAICWSPEELDDAGGRARVAAELDAIALQKARRVAPGELSLSPASLSATPAGARILMTSLNGGRCVAAAASAPWTAIGGLTNRSSVAQRIEARLDDGIAARCTIVACGEQWSSPFMRSATGSSAADQRLRPGIEDLIGAGAIVDALAGHRRRSVEAEVAAATFRAATPPARSIRDCVSGRELIERGFSADVDIAVDVDRWVVVPERGLDDPLRTFTHAA